MLYLHAMRMCVVCELDMNTGVSDGQVGSVL
jgi:hypothetical protein